MTNRRPEILAPCGNIEAYYAAEHAGADAVYLAGKMFGARSYAGNFSEDEILEVLESAHVHGVNVYLTLNTLLKEQETEALYRYLSPLYKAGLDGILVQDFGVLRIVKALFPELPIHTSTQMNICSTYGAKLAKETGAVRVVPARELSLSELKRIKDEVGIEVEAFVHGAMCFSYSGRCLLSSMIGGRSGNRGKCAQPCRQKYGENYAMSMKDMCTLHSVPELMKAGIDSLKIEGRMKSPYYVASCIEAYRKMEDDVLSGCFSKEKADYYERRLAEIFNRGMFSNGYLFQHHGDNMMDVLTPGRQGVKVGTVLGTKAGQVHIDVTETINKQDILGIRNAEKYSDDPIVLTSGQAVQKGEKAFFSAPRTKEIHIKDTVYRLQNTFLQKELEEKLIKPHKKLPVKITFSSYCGAPVQLALETVSKGKKIKASVFGPVAEYTDTPTEQEDYVKDKICKLGTTDYYLDKFEYFSDGYSFIPASELKKLRREGIEKLEQASRCAFVRVDEGCFEKIEELKKEVSESEEREMSFDTSLELNKQICKNVYYKVPSFRILEQVMSVIQPSVNELGNENSRSMILYQLDDQTELSEIKNNIEFVKANHFPAYFEMPLIYRDSMDKVDEIADVLSCSDGVVLTNIDTLQMYLEFVKTKRIEAKHVILDFSLYAYNKSAMVQFEALLKNFSKSIRFICSEEVSRTEREKLYSGRSQVIVPEYERVLYMITAQRLNTDFMKKDNQKLLVFHNDTFGYDRIMSDEAFYLGGSEKEVSGKDDEVFEQQFGHLYVFTNESFSEICRVLKGEKMENASSMRYFRGIE